MATTHTERTHGTARNENFRRTMSAGTLVGDKVTNRQGDELGNLKELMIDVENGRIAYAVLQTGSFLGMGGKLLAIPFQAFGVDEANHRLILDVPKETLKSAEGFDKDNWPDTTDLEFGRRIHGHYGIEPYWERL